MKACLHPGCQHTNPDNARFCGRCGAPYSKMLPTHTAAILWDSFKIVVLVSVVIALLAVFGVIG